MKNEIEISVIIPVYNVEKNLRKCIDSVLEQRDVKYEIILVNDGSTDLSPIICDEYAQKYDSISVIHKKNEGLGYARNSGLDVAKGEYIFFLDSDDWIVPDTFLHLLNIARENNTEIVCFQFIRVSDQNYVLKKQPKLEVKIVNNFELMKEYFSGMSATAWSKMYKREIFNISRFSKVSIHEDAYSMHLFMECAKKAAITNQIYYIQYIRSGSLTQSKIGEKNFICIECGERIVEFAKNEYPDLLEYAYFNLLERQMYMINLIISHFQYKKFVRQFNNILEDVQKELRFLEKKRYLNVKLYDSAKKLVVSPRKYIWFKTLDAYIYFLRIRVSSIIKNGGNDE